MAHYSITGQIIERLIKNASYVCEGNTRWIPKISSYTPVMRLRESFSVSSFTGECQRCSELERNLGQQLYHKIKERILHSAWSFVTFSIWSLLLIYLLTVASKVEPKMRKKKTRIKLKRFHYVKVASWFFCGVTHMITIRSPEIINMLPSFHPVLFCCDVRHPSFIHTLTCHRIMRPCNCNCVSVLLRSVVLLKTGSF